MWGSVEMCGDLWRYVDICGDQWGSVEIVEICGDLQGFVDIFGYGPDLYTNTNLFLNKSISPRPRYICDVERRWGACRVPVEEPVTGN